MGARDPIHEATVGRNLAETAALNAPRRQAAVAAAEAVRRRRRHLAGATEAPRRFRRALLWAVLALGSFAALAGLLEAIGL